MINIRRVAAKSAISLLIAASVITTTAACLPGSQVNPVPPQNEPDPIPISSQLPAPSTGRQPVALQSNSEPTISDNTSQTQPKASVEIILIHHRGTLSRIGCCNAMLYERDEFVVIQNRGNAPQDITNWSLTNITRGYPTFRFPSYFPCIPNILTEKEDEVSESRYSVVLNPAQSEENRLKPEANTAETINESGTCASCTAIPLDQTPMKPAKGQQGLPVTSVLYPGQTILVFTDEMHCDTGGFSFNWGQGNIWNNETPDTAVLYDSQGAEVSRRSYTVDR